MTNEGYRVVYAEKDDMSFIFHEYTTEDGKEHIVCKGWFFGKMRDDEITDMLLEYCGNECIVE